MDVTFVPLQVQVKTLDDPSKTEYSQVRDHDRALIGVDTYTYVHMLHVNTL